MRTKTLFSLIVLCGSTAALANLPARQDAPLQNDMTNEGVPAPDASPLPGPGDTMANDSMSNATDVEPSTEAPQDGAEDRAAPPESPMNESTTPNAT